jgi:flagellum-specific ATP synthase
MEEDDLQDPIVDAARAILDGHVVLSRKMAEQGLYPAIDVGSSLSRVMSRLAKPAQLQDAQHFRALWQCYQEQQDLINIGAYQHGSDAKTDEAILHHESMCDFIRQGADEKVLATEAQRRLASLFDSQARGLTDMPMGAGNTTNG